VIRPETCVPCGKRIRFGKMAVKCRNCRLFQPLTSPELNNFYKMTSPGSVRGRIGNMGYTISNT
ncbi:hypothetical protein GOODEAATRI_025036, partial [Goodea atripinnis]